MMQTLIDFGHGPVPWYSFAGASETVPSAHLAPANGLPAASYESFIESFNGELNFTAMNARGAWASEPPPSKFTWHDHTQDLIAAIESQHSQPVIGLGHSFGATKMIMAAVQRPDLFSRVVAIEPASTPSRLTDIVYKNSPDWLVRRIFPLIKSSHQRQSVWTSQEAFFNRYRGRGTFKNFTDRALRDYAKYGLQQLPTGDYQLLIQPHWESHIFRNVEFVWKHLRSLNVPTLLLKAEHTYMYTQDHFDKQCARLGANITASTIHGAGHLMTHEIPGQLSRNIRDWLR